MSEVVAEKKVIIMHYTLTTSDEQQADTSVGGEPLCYLHGAGNIVPGLETALTGASVGSKHHVEVPAANGYGERTGVGPQPVPRSVFPDDMPLEEGMPFFAEGDDGEPSMFWIVEVTDDTIHIDNNHPLAGVDLTFDVEIVGIRDANEDELAHGHPHGIDGTAGHHH